VKEKLSLEEELDALSRKIEFNFNMIKELESKNDNLLKEKEEQRKQLEETEKVEIEKFSHLEKRYNDLVKKTKEFEFLEEIRENETVTVQRRSSIQFKQKEEGEM
jgi:hypothetical protein